MTADKRPLLAKVHIAKAQLNLDDEQYRDVLRRVTGKDSAAQCRYSQLVDLINEFKALGWKTPKKKAFRRTPFDGIKKIYALWSELQALGAVQSTDKTALDAFCKKYTGIDSVQWLLPAQQQKIIEILKQWIKRIGG